MLSLPPITFFSFSFFFSFLSLSYSFSSLSRLFRLLEFAFSLINVCAHLADLQDRFGGTIALLPF